MCNITFYDVFLRHNNNNNNITIIYFDGPRADAIQN